MKLMRMHVPQAAGAPYGHNGIDVRPVVRQRGPVWGGRPQVLHQREWHGGHAVRSGRRHAIEGLAEDVRIGRDDLHGLNASAALVSIAAALRRLLQRALASGRAVVVSRMSAVLTPWNSFWLMS